MGYAGDPSVDLIASRSRPHCQSLMYYFLFLTFFLSQERILSISYFRPVRASPCSADKDIIPSIDIFTFWQVSWFLDIDLLMRNSSWTFGLANLRKSKSICDQFIKMISFFFCRKIVFARTQWVLLSSYLIYFYFIDSIISIYLLTSHEVVYV